MKGVLPVKVAVAWRGGIDHITCNVQVTSRLRLSHLLPAIPADPHTGGETTTTQSPTVKSVTRTYKHSWRR